VTLKGSDLRLRLRGKDPAALAVLVRAMSGRGVSGACDLLGLSKSTIYRISADWPPLAKALAKHAIDPTTRGVMGGLASVASGRGGRRKRA